MIFDEMNFQNPLIMIISRGEDPVVNFLKLMKDVRISPEQYYIVSMG